MTLPGDLPRGLPREAWRSALQERPPGQGGPPTSLEYQASLRRAGWALVTLRLARETAAEAGLALSDWP